MSKPKQIKISEILEHLTSGYTRLKADKNYDSKVGSIQEKYELSRSQIAELFKHPKLKGRKTISPKLSSFEIVDDTEGKADEEADTLKNEEIIEKRESAPSNIYEHIDNRGVGAPLEDNNNTEEVSTPDTQTSTDIDDAADEEQPKLDSADVEVVKVEEKTAESPGEDGDEWLPN